MIAAYTLSHNKFPSLKDMIKNILLITHNDYDAMVCAIVASMIPTKKNFDVKYYGSPVIS